MTFEPETMDKMMAVCAAVTSLEQVIWLAAPFIRGIGFYILYRMLHLKFLKVLIWAEVAGVGYWVWANRLFFFHRWLTEEDPSDGKFLILLIIGLAAELLPLLLGMIGAIMGLCYIQKRWKEKQLATVFLEKDAKSGTAATSQP